MTTDHSSRSAARAAGPQTARTPWLLIIGLLTATAPAWLFGIAAATAGPRTSVLIFGIPVLASTAASIWISLTLNRQGLRARSLIVGILALIVGVLMYTAWAYLAGLGLRFGDGPL